MTRTPFSASPFDQMVQDQFAAAMELAFSQSMVDPLPPGHISLEEKSRGGTYAKWRRLGADGKPASPLYLGVAGSEPHLAALAQKEELERIERTARQMRKLGLAAEDHASAVVLATLANAGFFRGGGMLVGTRAFRCLTNHLGYHVTPTVATQDVDIARPHAIALATPMPTGGLQELLQKTGFRFIDVPGLRHNEPSTSWRVIGKEIKIDLLAPSQRSAKAHSAVAIPELGAHATVLPHLDYLVSDGMDAVVIGKSQLVPVRVPLPARFCWHKLAVSQLRPATFSAKASKDLLQAACLAVCLWYERSDELIDARAILPAAMQKLITRAWPAFASLLGKEHQALAEAMAL